MDKPAGGDNEDIRPELGSAAEPVTRSIPVVWESEAETQSPEPQVIEAKPVEPDLAEIIAHRSRNEHYTHAQGIPYTQLIINKIQINFNFHSWPKIPSVQQVKAAFINMNRRQRMATSLAAAALLLTIAAIPLLGNTRDTQGAPLIAAQGLPKENPNFKTLLPKGKSIDDLGGWRRVSPEESNPVYTYVDAVKSVRINVSQQPLPQSFEKDVAGKVENLARSFNATQQITTSETTVHVGTNANGSQSAVTSKKNLLILIKAENALTLNEWAEYVQSLR